MSVSALSVAPRGFMNPRMPSGAAKLLRATTLVSAFACLWRDARHNFAQLFSSRVIRGHCHGRTCGAFQIGKAA